jgi:small subunit ribosomal protein S3
MCANCGNAWPGCKPRGPRRDARPGDRPGSDRPAPRGARAPRGATNTAPVDGSDKPAEATPGSEAPKTTVKRVRKAAPAAAADGAKTE